MHVLKHHIEIVLVTVNSNAV